MPDSVLLSLSSLEGHHLDLVSRDDLGDERWLVDDEARLQFLDALATGLKSLLHRHFLPVVLVKH